MEKLEQHDGGYLAPVVRFAAMGRAAIAEQILFMMIRAPRAALHGGEIHSLEAGKDKGRQIEV